MKLKILLLEKIFLESKTNKEQNIQSFLSAVYTQIYRLVCAKSLAKNCCYLKRVQGINSSHDFLIGSKRNYSKWVASFVEKGFAISERYRNKLFFFILKDHFMNKLHSLMKKYLKRQYFFKQCNHALIKKFFPKPHCQLQKIIYVQNENSFLNLLNFFACQNQI